MNEHWVKVEEEIRHGVPGPNTSCQYYPCHFVGQDCSLCFCPFYPCLDPMLGEFVTTRKGNQVWSCQYCFWSHRSDVASDSRRLLQEIVDDPDETRIAETKAKVEMMHAKSASTIMVMGATSGAGKSLLVAALCRILSDIGYNVAPFKSQNMSLNSMVTRNGEEIARIQGLQARAARTEPDASMNPILLKPKKDDVSQVIVDGRPYKDMNVQDYYSKFTNTEGVEIIRKSYEFLRRTRDVIVVEGAGSPAEINISAQEIANMRTAEITHASCLLVVNIEWGGAFAYIYGTLQLLSPEHKRMFKGIIINNLRGSDESLAEGIRMIEEEVGIPVLGVVPHFDHALPDEDSMTMRSSNRGGDSLRIAVVRLPRISNFTDYDALFLEDGVSVSFVDDPVQLREMDAIIIPGTKNTIADLEWMKEKGLYEAIREMGGKVPILGVCGGYQMLGRTIIDTQGLEGGRGQECDGLGLLDVITHFETYDKRTVQIEGRMVCNNEVIRGYEIHMGRTENLSHQALFSIDDGGGEKLDGAVSPDGMVMGTYVHGLFDLPPFRRHFISLIKRRELGAETMAVDYDQAVEDSLDRLAATVRESIDMECIMDMITKERVR